MAKINIGSYHLLGFSLIFPPLYILMVIEVVMLDPRIRPTEIFLCYGRRREGRQRLRARFFNYSNIGLH
jgi:hypothetical protein